jgi:hypothetical protein
MGLFSRIYPGIVIVGKLLLGLLECGSSGAQTAMFSMRLVLSPWIDRSAHDLYLLLCFLDRKESIWSVAVV